MADLRRLSPEQRQNFEQAATSYRETLQREGLTEEDELR